MSIRYGLGMLAIGMPRARRPWCRAAAMPMTDRTGASRANAFSPERWCLARRPLRHAQRNQSTVLIDVERHRARRASGANRPVPLRTGRLGRRGRACRPRPHSSGTTRGGERGWKVNPPSSDGRDARAGFRMMAGTLFLGDDERLSIVDRRAVPCAGGRHRSVPTTFFRAGTSRRADPSLDGWVVHSAPDRRRRLFVHHRQAVDVPNCAAPRGLPTVCGALLSPTFCEEDKPTPGRRQWTNPDPVSVIDLGADGPRFRQTCQASGRWRSTPRGDVRSPTRRPAMDEAMFETSRRSRVARVHATI